MPGSLLGQIGRGYSDLCAALCAVGLRASELQIWKEVDGIYTADPRIVPQARLLDFITPEETSELTYYGSEVIHPFTMEQVIRASIPIRIKNICNAACQGTLIFPTADPIAKVDDRNSSKQSTPQVNQHKTMATAITIKDEVIIINILSHRKTMSHGFLAQIFTVLDQFGVIVDLVSTSEVHVSMVIANNLEWGLLERLIANLNLHGRVSLLRCYCFIALTVSQVTTKPHMSIVSIIGIHMKHNVGVAGRMFTVLAQGDINIEMISQGASEINISCVVASTDAVRAVQLIHAACLSIPED